MIEVDFCQNLCILQKFNIIILYNQLPKWISTNVGICKNAIFKENILASRSPKSKHALCLLALHFLCIYANQWPLAMFGKLPRFRVLQLCGLPFHASHNGRSRTGADLWAFASEPDKLPDRVNFANLVADYLVNICILVICTRMRDKTPGATYILIEGNDLFFIKNFAKVTMDPRVAFAKRTAFKVMSQFSQNSASESRAEPPNLD